MQPTSTLFKEVFLFKSKNHKDKRGSFSEQFRRFDFNKAIGDKIDFCQDNIVHSKKGVLRGLHYQLYPNAQSKLIIVIQGTVLDVVVDIRKGSPTFRKYLTQELSDQNNLQLFIPRGFAHGYITLSEKSIVQYKVDNFYSKKHDKGYSINDEFIKIKSSKKKFILSNKDLNLPNFSDKIKISKV